MTNEVQGAVCGTCGGEIAPLPISGWSHVAPPGGPRSYDHSPSPAPVVPSDDAEWDCAECGVPMGMFHGGTHAWTPTAAGVAALERSESALLQWRARNAAPPTPSQDADGCEIEYGVTCGALHFCDRPRGHGGEHAETVASSLLRIESAIRATYEDLVKAALDARSAIVLLTSELSGQVGYIKGMRRAPHGRPQLAIDHAHAVGARLAAALESLGGRK